MKSDEVRALLEVMQREHVEEADLEFFTEQALKEAGVDKAITRAKVLRCIREHFKGPAGSAAAGGTERAVRPLLEAEADAECCMCLKAEDVGKLLALVPCGHRCVCADCSALVVGHTCPVCRTEARQAIRVFD
jgi:hypothetical protein